MISSGSSSASVITKTVYLDGIYTQVMFEGLESEFDTNWSDRTNLIYE